MKQIKTQKSAAEYCGISRWQLQRLEKKRPDIQFKDPQTGEYDVQILDEILAGSDPHYAKTLQSECIIAIGEIRDPARLKAIKVIVDQIHKLNIHPRKLFENEN